jgi:hypothetical protein
MNKDDLQKLKWMTQRMLADAPAPKPIFILDQFRPEVCPCDTCDARGICVQSYDPEALCNTLTLTIEQQEAFIDFALDDSMLKARERVVIVPIKDRDGPLPKVNFGELPELAGPYGYEGEVRFTCEGCTWRGICSYSFDNYNTDGDCLASK